MQLLNSKDSSQIECSIWFLHQRAISNCSKYCFGLLGLISFSFLFLRRMAGPPVGSAMPARHSMQTTYRLKGGAQARQTRRGNEPPPLIKHFNQKFSTKTPHTNNTYLRKETDLDFGITGTLGDENGKAVGWLERRLVCLVRGLRGISSTVRDG